MIYNKEQKDHRKLKASGPRNMQARTVAVDTSEDIKELKAEITKLAGSGIAAAGGYTQQQVDDMLNEAIEEVSVDLEKKYVQNIKQLKARLVAAGDEVQKLSESLDKKDKLILDLTTKITDLASRPVTVVQGNKAEVEEVSDRPSMNESYIDPAKRGAEDKMESHVKIKEIKSKADTGANINKLKNLMGKLPKK